ncbi:MAG: inorganic diphosphatase [Pseudolabrys sp.]
MRVLIENEAGSRRKNTYDERTFALVGSAEVSAAYPFAYGFVIGTRAGDGDAADCFVLSARRLSSGEIVDCEPLALIEQIEDGETDHKLIAAPKGETAAIDDAVASAIRAFAANVFSHVPGKRMEIGRLLGRSEAQAYLTSCRQPA